MVYFSLKIKPLTRSHLIFPPEIANYSWARVPSSHHLRHQLLWEVGVSSTAESLGRWLQSSCVWLDSRFATTILLRISSTVSYLWLFWAWWLLFPSDRRGFVSDWCWDVFGLIWVVWETKQLPRYVLPLAPISRQITSQCACWFPCSYSWNLETERDRVWFPLDLTLSVFSWFSTPRRSFLSPALFIYKYEHHPPWQDVSGGLGSLYLQQTSALIFLSKAKKQICSQTSEVISSELKTRAEWFTESFGIKLKRSQSKCSESIDQRISQRQENTNARTTDVVSWDVAHHTTS